jgi:hypothetical protein
MTVYAFRIIANFNEVPRGIRYRVGMQGQLSEIDTNKQLGKIFIRGVTEHNGCTHAWVPLRFIEKGKRWEADISKWRVKIQLPSHYNFDRRGWDTASSPDTTVLGKTIARLITALHSSPPTSPPPKFSQYLEGHDTAVLGQNIVDSIKRSGLYEVLSSGRSFSVGDLQNAS